ncbi:hypothetical protein LCGC14_1098890 [marine sediment metagenome]|uniref:Uncharacterized protein n=1 Tax=marine sediment metagenome TaxID=412755 RepID=A0A0F9PT77_9ZZZZ
MRVYTFQRDRSTVVHGVVPLLTPIGSALLDSVFGGGMRLLCQRETASGPGVLSETLRPMIFVTCRRCLRHQ